MNGLETQIAGALVAALAGVAVGWAHFRSLRMVTERIVAGRLSAVALQLARLALLTLFFVLCARFGALPLVAAAAGVLAGRAAVLRHAERAT